MCRLKIVRVVLVSGKEWTYEKIGCNFTLKLRPSDVLNDELDMREYLLFANIILVIGAIQ